jgi:hypothetical protein
LLYRYKEPFLSKHVFSKINHTFVQLGKICWSVIHVVFTVLEHYENTLYLLNRSYIF